LQLSAVVSGSQHHTTATAAAAAAAAAAAIHITATSMSVSLLDLSAAELIARGIAPIRKEYRLPAIRYRQQQQPTETAAATAATADDDAEAAGAAAATTGGATAAVAADGEGGYKRVKSKRQKKRVRTAAGLWTDSTTLLCMPFILHLGWDEVY